LTEESERPQAGEEEAETVELGTPQREVEREEHEDVRPDLDERHERIRTTRKPMGPPLTEPDEAEAMDDTFAEDARETDEPPVDPGEPQE
jgi:hypothetical protein